MLEGGSKGLLIAAAALLALAFVSRERVAAFQAESAVKAAQSRDAGLAFVTRFEGRQQDLELKLLDERRRLAHRALRWSVAGTVAWALSLLLLLAAWTLRQLARAGLEAEAAGLGPGPGP